MAEPHGRHHLQQKRLERLLLVGKRLQPHLVEAVAHRRGVGVARPMLDVPFHASATSTETFTSCRPPPVMMPATGLTSPKSRPNAMVMCSSAGSRLFVGSKSRQPAPGQNTENHAC